MDKTKLLPEGEIVLLAVCRLQRFCMTETKKDMRRRRTCFLTKKNNLCEILPSSLAEVRHI